MASTEQDQADDPTADLVSEVVSPRVLASSVVRSINPMAPVQMITLISSDESMKLGSMNSQFQEEFLSSVPDF